MNDPGVGCSEKSFEVSLISDMYIVGSKYGARQFEPQCRRVELTEATYNERSMSYDDSFAFWGRFEDRALRTGSGV